MAELNLGNKFECYNCGARFYDLGKPDPVCPKCGANQKDAERNESPAVSQAARRKRKADLGKALVETEDDVPIEDLPEDELEGAGLEADLDADADTEEEDFDDDEA